MNRLLAFVVALWLGLDTCPAPVDFDGSDDLVNIGDVATLDLTSTDFTISFWVYWPSANANENKGFCGKYDIPSGQRGWAVFSGTTGSSDPLYQTQGAVAFWYQSNAGSFNVNEVTGTGTFTIDDDAWHHIAATFRQSTQTEIYVDAIRRANRTTNVPASVASNTAPVQIGSYSGNEFDGIIQNVRIYTRALSSAEIETMYLSRIGEGNPVSSELVGYWPLNDNSGNLASATFVDRSGNGNNGTGSDAGGSGGQCSRETFLTSP